MKFEVKPGSWQALQLLEAAKRLGLKPLVESVEDDVWKQLMDYKEGLEVEAEKRCEIDAQDEKTIKADMTAKLKQGWTKAELFNYYKWSEYFDDYTHTEDECLKKMHEISTRVQDRLKK